MPRRRRRPAAALPRLAAATVALTCALAAPGSAVAIEFVTLSLPGDIVAEAEGPDGAVVTYTATATNHLKRPVEVVCSPASGSTFPLGTTTVSCTAEGTDGPVTGSFTVTVRDTTPPALTVPADVTVAAESPGGTPAERLAAFLGSAGATDLVTASPAISHDAPAVFPVGQTTVTFTASDAAGNQAQGSATVTVTPYVPVAQPSSGSSPPPPASTPQPQPQPAPPAASDRTPPANVTSMRVQTASRRVQLTWVGPPDADFSHVTVFRSLSRLPAATAVAAYRGNGTTFTDRGLRNGVEYRFVVVTYDRSGNRSAGVAISATPKRILLWNPKEGRRFVGATMFVWAPMRGARYYNMQLFRNGRKVLSVWPTRSRYYLRASWRFAGRAERLRPGRYVWYVWPGRGARKLGEYGPLMGSSRFVVVPKATP